MLSSVPLPVSDVAPKLDGGALELTITVSRPDKSSSAGTACAIGVAVVIRGDSNVVSIRWSGYAASEDMGRAAAIAFALKHVRQSDQRLIVHCRGLKTLEWVPAARLRGGKGTGKNRNGPFAAYPLFDAVEATSGKYWFHQSFDKGEEPSDHWIAKREADAALDEARDLVAEFCLHRAVHPDWCFLTGVLNESPEAVTCGAL